MENPATWGEAEKIIRQVRIEHEEARREFVCGLSLEMKIANALRLAGLLIEKENAAK